MPRPLIALILWLAAAALGAAEEAPKTAAWWNNQWLSRKKITIDTSAEGANLSDSAGSATMLLRLHDGVFNFMAAAEDGSDLRFVADDQKTVLPHHIEKWDGLLNEAYVWVKVPEVKGATKFDLWMYYSVAQPQPADAKKDKFDADTRLVYHFAEAGPGTDSSSSAVNAEGVPAPASSSHIGSGLRLNGQAAITVPASPALAWSAGGTATVMLWVKPAALQTKAVVFSRREGAASFVIQLDQGIPSVVVGTQSSAPGTALTPNTWNHLAVTANGNSMTLFVNGAQYATLAAPLPATIGGASIGKDSQGTAAGFAGELDELQLHAKALTPAQIKLAFINQGTTPDAAKLLTLGSEEAAHVEHEGVIMEHVHLLTDIAKDLTIDGWAVIIACTLLALVGGFIAVGKVMYLNKIEKASAAFIQQWEKVSSDLTALEDKDGLKSMGGAVQGAKTQRLMNQSPLYHLYHLGCTEVQKRMKNVRKLSLDPDKPRNEKGLSGRSIQAIKATLHGGLMREVQTLNSKLVFLTIGIAGGPYLGLLGTVIGVMITFAVIAKSGQVEVNSIAPGIAGALLATVAGLAVAIPALFAYSYISTRIKNVVTDMETFIDEFIAKMAEHYKE